MSPKNGLDEVCASSFLAEGHDVVATRRTLLLAALAAGLPLAASSTTAQASKLDPAQTMITFPDAIKFVPWSGAPPHSRGGCPHVACGSSDPFTGVCDLDRPYRGC